MRPLKPGEINGLFGYLRDINAKLDDTRDKVVEMRTDMKGLPAIREAVDTLLDERKIREDRKRRRRGAFALACSLVAIVGTIAGILSQLR